MKFSVLFVVAVFGLSACWAFPAAPARSKESAVVRGDILLTPEQNAFYFGDNKGRTGLTDTNTRWPDNTIPYTFVGQTDAEKQIVVEALRDMESKTCIKFVERTTQTDYVFITKSEAGCWSWVGRVGGAQQLNLEEGCYAEVVVQHEFIHALGFFHMQSAYDRDTYVTVKWDNITPGMEHNFDKVNPDTTSQFYEAYDYYSIMHYPGWAFSHNGQDTMVANQPGVTLDYRWVMTEKDIRRLENMYCPGPTPA